jgi:hypothetical protein
MIAIDVDPNSYFIMVCENNEDVFLFTCGLSTCLGIAATGKTSTGKTILGIAHTYSLIEDGDMLEHNSIQKNDISKATLASTLLRPEQLDEALQIFHPDIFNKLINSIKTYQNPAERIEIYLAGGQGKYPGQHQLYCEYIKCRMDLKLCDTALNLYHINEQNPSGRFDLSIARTLSTTLGVSSRDKVLVAKRMPLDGIENLANSDEFIDACRKQQINFPPNPDLVFGFSNLTWQYLHRRDFEYRYDTGTRIISKKP